MLYKFLGRCRLEVELLANRVEFSTTIHISAEQAKVIRERNLFDYLDEFVKTYAFRKSPVNYKVEAVRITFTEEARLKVSGVKLVIRLFFPKGESFTMHYAGAERTLAQAFKDIRHEISTRTGVPFVNHSTSPGRSLGKSGESIASLKKERNRAQRELDNLKRLIEFGKNRRSSSKKRKGSD
jgi:hypothetical protein